MYRSIIITALSPLLDSYFCHNILGKTLVASDGTVSEKSSTNANCCLRSANSIDESTDGSRYRWPMLYSRNGKLKCSGGMKKTFQEWIDYAARGFREGICYKGWRYQEVQGAYSKNVPF